MHEHIALMFDAEAQWLSGLVFQTQSEGWLHSSPGYCHCVVSLTKKLCSSFMLHPGIKLDTGKHINNTGGGGGGGCKLASHLGE